MANPYAPTLPPADPQDSLARAIFGAIPQPLDGGGAANPLVDDPEAMQAYLAALQKKRGSGGLSQLGGMAGGLFGGGAGTTAPMMSGPGGLGGGVPF